MPKSHRVRFEEKVHCKTGHKDIYGRCIDRPFTPTSRPIPKPPSPSPKPAPTPTPTPKPKPTPTPPPTPFNPFQMPDFSPFTMPYDPNIGQSALEGAAIGAVSGGALGAVGMSLGQALSSSGAGYASIPGDIEMGNMIPTANTVGEEVANPRGYYTSSRLVASNTMRYRPVPTDNEFEDVTLEDDKPPTQSVASRAMQSAQRALRQIKVKLGTDYSQVPRSEVEADQDIEMGNIESAQEAETDAVNEAFEASAQETTDVADVADDTTLVTDATENVAEAAGGDVMTDALGADIGVGGDIEMADLGTTELASAVSDVGIDAGTEVAVDAGAEAASIGTAEAAAAPLDIVTFGLASVAAAGVGAAVGAGVGAAVSASSSPSTPTPGVQQLNQSQVNNLKTKLQGQPNSTATLNTLNKYSSSQPVALVTTDSNQSVVVAQLSQQQLAKAAASLQAKPDLFVGQDQYILQAMGINPSLAKTPYTPGTNPFSGTITVPVSSIAQQKTLLDQQTATINGASTSVSAAQSQLSAAQVAASNAQATMITDQDQVSLSKAQLVTTTAQSQAAYAANIQQINEEDQTKVNEYNAALSKEVQTVANQYDDSVAATNVASAAQATSTTQLLRYNITAAYKANKMTYTPLSTTLPAIASSSKVAVQNALTNAKVATQTVSTNAATVSNVAAQKASNAAKIAAQAASNNAKVAASNASVASKTASQNAMNAAKVAAQAASTNAKVAASNASVATKVASQNAANAAKIAAQKASNAAQVAASTKTKTTTVKTAAPAKVAPTQIKPVAPVKTAAPVKVTPTQIKTAAPVKTAPTQTKAAAPIKTAAPVQTRPVNTTQTKIAPTPVQTKTAPAKS